MFDRPAYWGYLNAAIHSRLVLVPTWSVSREQILNLFLSGLVRPTHHHDSSLSIKNVLFRIPFRTAASTSDRSRSPPIMLLRDCSDPSAVFCSTLGNIVPPRGISCGSALTETLFRSASILTMDTCGALPSICGFSLGDPTVDLGRNIPTKDRDDRFTPLPILRNITDAEDAVEDTDKLSVERLKRCPW